MDTCTCGHTAANHKKQGYAKPCFHAQFGYDSEGWPIGKTCQCGNYAAIGGPVKIKKKSKSKALVASSTPKALVVAQSSTPPGRWEPKAKFHTGHRVEQHAKVYLVLSDDGSRWEIDAINFDGFPLDGLNTGPMPNESACECDNEVQCWEAHNHAAALDLPTGKEITDMLYEFYYGGNE